MTEKRSTVWRILVCEFEIVSHFELRAPNLVMTSRLAMKTQNHDLLGYSSLIHMEGGTPLLSQPLSS